MNDKDSLYLYKKRKMYLVKVLTNTRHHFRLHTNIRI